MKPGLLISAVMGLLATTTTVATAQRLPPLPPPPVVLTVVRPIPPVPLSPRPDLYQQPTPPQPMPPTFIYNPGFMYGPSPHHSPKPADPEPIARAGLRFETMPGSAQVYVNGFYAGVIDDFGVSGRVLELEAGSHRVELRATGYQSAAFHVSLAPNETVRYRGDLQRLVPPPPPPATSIAATSRATYIVPNCYAGDRPPMRALPRGCDLRRMRVEKP